MVIGSQWRPQIDHRGASRPTCIGKLITHVPSFTSIIILVHDFSLRTQHCRHVYNCYWSGVFNLLEFDHTLKKKIIAIHSICWVDRDQISAWGFEIVVTEVLRSCGEGGVYKTTYFCAICFVASLGWISPTAKCWTLVVVSVCRFSVKHIRCKRRVYFHNTESVQCISIR